MTVEHAGRTNGRVAPQPPPDATSSAVADDVPSADAPSGGAGLGRVVVPVLLAAAAIILIRRFAQRADA